MRLLRLTFRNHRKVVLTDGATAIVGGLNLADEYDGDGVVRGWRDFRAGAARTNRRCTVPELRAHVGSGAVWAFELASVRPGTIDGNGRYVASGAPARRA